MRRWLAVLLLVFLPLQAVWAAAAPYCHHEEGASTLHVGHHAHEHASPQADDDSADGPAASHADCHVCHGGAGAVTAFIAAPEHPAWRARAHPPAAALPAAPVALPERPNWARLA
jgi:hypothetical protein